MDKNQCIVFRKNTTDRLRVSSSVGTSVACTMLLKDKITGEVGWPYTRRITNTSPEDLGPLFAASVNDFCLEDLSIMAVNNLVTDFVAVYLVVPEHPTTPVLLWGGTIPAGKRLRFRESTGFVVE